MANYYYQDVCVDGGGNSGKIGSDEDPPVSQGLAKVDQSLEEYFWVGFMLVYYQGGLCNKTVDTSNTVTLLVDKDGGGWESLAVSELAAPGVGAMQYPNLTPGNADWFTGDTSSCCSNAESTGVAQDNSGSLATGTGTGNGYRKEFWFAIDPQGATAGSTYTFAIYDSAEKFGTLAAPFVLDCSVNMAGGTETLEIIEGDMEHIVYDVAG